ncbi:uncharacterized protein PGTG_09382 [Puccinia graminis f. sp. tritici CRL 75-36-700-3]|uniref:Uncharacterized protein n=1 Tax=Puccinia graminis f. sp. tritici (strain CRL 75-36-700-3 / race SCCL) TaxID=418459 RepID=E3KH94_PUCGT|nr:uncharacterized protein PGTG_09382 [Puccinia graminis f. sp. tritici CRL 75-36-700-3]EFP83669.2 hypothetical protein PGTG_09382 [Puccinia graminis f. sp. tritici CRL 75-36-700-3]
MKNSIYGLALVNCLFSLEVGAASTSFSTQSQIAQLKRHVGAAALAPKPIEKEPEIETSIGSLESSFNANTPNHVLPTKTNDESSTSVLQANSPPPKRRARRDLLDFFAKAKAKSSGKAAASATGAAHAARQINPFPPNPLFYSMGNDLGFQPMFGDDPEFPESMITDGFPPMGFPQSTSMAFREESSFPFRFEDEVPSPMEFPGAFFGNSLGPRSSVSLEMDEDEALPLRFANDVSSMSDSSNTDDETESEATVVVVLEIEEDTTQSEELIIVELSDDDDESTSESSHSVLLSIRDDEDLLAEDDSDSADDTIIVVEIDEDARILAPFQEDDSPMDDCSNEDGEDLSSTTVSDESEEDPDCSDLTSDDDEVDEDTGLKIASIEADGDCSIQSDDDEVDEDTETEALIIVLPETVEDPTLLSQPEEEGLMTDAEDATISVAQIFVVVDANVSPPSLLVQGDRPSIRGSTSLVSVNKLGALTSPTA